MKRLRLKLDLTAVIVLIAAGVLLPVMLAAAVGIVALFIARDAGGIVTGVLVVCFAAAAMGSAVVAVVLTARKARLARLQADFLANVTHELRTPLSVIRLYAQTLEAGVTASDPRQAADCVRTILREAAWLDATVDEVLTWRASTQYGLPPVLRAQPLTEAVESAVARFRAMTVPDDMAFTSTVNTCRRVRHDVKALSGVILNLLTNAYKYTGRRKTIALRVYDEDDSIGIDVRDNGPGVTVGEARRIFDPFYRAPRHAAGVTGGIGLGLAIARHVVEQHGGSIHVTSGAETGATFSIRLPAVKDQP